MFKNMRLLILFDPNVKMTASFTSIARTTGSTNKFTLLGKISNQELGLYMKNNF